MSTCACEVRLVSLDGKIDSLWLQHQCYPNAFSDRSILKSLRNMEGLSNSCACGRYPVSLARDY
eukprot:260620-Pyramimonas_sp.AAC.1